MANDNITKSPPSVEKAVKNPRKFIVLGPICFVFLINDKIGYNKIAKAFKKSNIIRNMIS